MLRVFHELMNQYQAYLYLFAFNNFEIFDNYGNILDLSSAHACLVVSVNIGQSENGVLYIVLILHLT